MSKWIYNKSFAQYNGRGQTFLKVLRSTNTPIYPSFPTKQQQQQQRKQKQKQKKENFLFHIVWSLIFL